MSSRVLSRNVIGGFHPRQAAVGNSPLWYVVKLRQCAVLAVICLHLSEAYDNNRMDSQPPFSTLKLQWHIRFIPQRYPHGISKKCHSIRPIE